MSMFQVSALASRNRTTSLNIESFGRSRRLEDIIEEDNRYSSSLPARPRAHTIEIATRKRTMSEKSDMDNFLNNQRRSSTGDVPITNVPRRTAPPPPIHSLSTGHSPPPYPEPSALVDYSSMAMSPPRPGTFSVRDQSRSSPSSSTTDSTDGPETLNLVHIDFVARDGQGDSKDDSDNFVDLIQKANNWIDMNPDIRIVAAETVTWSTPEKSRLFTDGAVTYKCMASGKKTKRTQGLRVWYVDSGDKFWLNAGPRQQLGFRDYLPGRDNGISAAVSQLNEDMRTKPIAGKLLRVETMHALQDTVTDVCTHKQSLDSNRKYFTFLRLIYLEVDGMSPVKAKIGLKDFIPKLNDRSPHSSGYESFSDLYGRAARWIYTQNTSRIINLQTLPVKIKKEDTQEKLQNISVWETAAFTEHGDKKTDYLRILRVVFLRYLKPTEQESLKYKLTTRIFTPRPLQSEATREADNKQETAISERTFEDLQMVEGRVKSWLVRSGARLLGIETVSTQCVNPDDRLLGRDSTFWTNQRDKNTPLETWVTHFRLFLDGNYRNIPDEV